jgi:hypothetical protein
MIGGKMKHYANPLNGDIWAYEEDGSQDNIINYDFIPIEGEILKNIRNGVFNKFIISSISDEIINGFPVKVINGDWIYEERRTEEEIALASAPAPPTQEEILNAKIELIAINLLIESGLLV